jgi:hypothetical protein
MFVMVMAAAFRIGDRAEVRINGEPATLTWLDEHTLVINDCDARRILIHEGGRIDGAGRPVQTFTCGDSERKVS